MQLDDLPHAHEHPTPRTQAVLDAERESRALAELPDAALVDRVAERMAVPRAAAADSFLLHAPLELMARAQLLALAAPDARPRIRARILTLPRIFDEHGRARDAPAPRTYADVEDARRVLAAAIAAGELDDAERAAEHLATHTSAAELARALADVVVPHLGAAAHGAIFLDELRRSGARSGPLARALSGLCRELARECGARLSWYRERDSSEPATDDLAARLANAPYAGDPGTSFIAPTMALVERTGLAERLLDGATRAVSVRDARRALGRVAAVSMLTDDPAHAPYGWSHALTMPRAILGIADGCARPSDAVAIAATHALGFRATLARGPIDLAYTPARPPRLERFELAMAAEVAAARVFHASADELPSLLTRIATYAAVHPDAHLAKYVVASFDAARDFPHEARLHFAAAANLASIWARTRTDDPLLLDYERGQQVR